MRRGTAVWWSTRAVEWLLPHRLVEEVLGDIVEEFELRSRSASGSAGTQWLLSQLCRSLAPVIWMSMRRDGWLVTIGAGIGSFVVVNALEAAADVLLLRALAAPAELQAGAGLLLGLAAVTFGGYIAGRVRSAAPIVLSLIVLTTVVVLMRMGAGSVPLWYQIGFLILGPLASLKGGALSANRTA